MYIYMKYNVIIQSPLTYNVIHYCIKMIFIIFGFIAPCINTLRCTVGQLLWLGKVSSENNIQLTTYDYLVAYIFASILSVLYIAKDITMLLSQYEYH